MAFLDFLKNEDGSWNVGRILVLVAAVLASLGAGYAAYYMFTRNRNIGNRHHDPAREQRAKDDQTQKNIHGVLEFYQTGQIKS